MNELKEALRKIGEERGKRCVLLTDMKGSTELFSQEGDIAAVKVQQQIDLSMEEIKNANGNAWPVGGDGILAFFESSTNGIKAIVNIQRRLEKEEFKIRAGLHTGDVFFDPSIQCQTINITSRIMSLADERQIFISEVVFKEIQGFKFNIHFHSSYPLKGLKEEMPIYEVLWYEGQKPKEVKLTSLLKDEMLNYLNTLTEEMTTLPKYYPQGFAFDEVRVYVQVSQELLKLRRQEAEERERIRRAGGSVPEEEKKGLMTHCGLKKDM